MYRAGNIAVNEYIALIKSYVTVISVVFDDSDKVFVDMIRINKSVSRQVPDETLDMNHMMQ